MTKLDEFGFPIDAAVLGEKKKEKRTPSCTTGVPNRTIKLKEAKDVEK